MAQKRPRPSSPSSTSQQQPQPDPEIYTSTTIHDRASTFQALFSPSHLTLSASKSLQQHGTIATSEHKILAWRFPSRQTTLAGAPPRFDAGHDDDGEKGAGIRLGRVLDAEGVTGTVVVGRWWGGVMLGPIRFTWIEQCAKEAIGMWRASQKDELQSSQQENVKRVKIGGGGVDEAAVEARMKEALVLELQGRDRNIEVLRELLRTKKERLDGVASPSASPAKVQEYSSLPMSRLRALDKARDATLSYILKQLDKVDQQQKEEDDIDAAFEQIADTEEKKKDEAALQEMLRTDEEENEAAFDEMERIAREMEQEIKVDQNNGHVLQKDPPRTPERPK